MITIPKNKVAVIPVFESEETKGGIIKAATSEHQRVVSRYDIYGTANWDREPRKLDEAEDKERALYLLDRYRKLGCIKLSYDVKKVTVGGDVYDTGNRCNQGVVKYIGSDVTSVQPGHYVFFSGYTGTLMEIEGEGLLIILPEKFIECIFDIDKFHEVPGLYFKSRDGTFFQATYEEAMNLMARTFTEKGVTVEIRSSKPKSEDYVSD